MSVIKTSILLVSLLGAFELHAKNFMTFMGGGGEPKGDDTIFDTQVEAMGAFNNQADWDTQVSFNGGHRETEIKIVKGFRKKDITNTPFTEQSYNKIIQDYEDKIRNGTIRTGDQILLMISTHGVKKINESELTHQISVKGGAVQNFDTGEGSRIVSLDKLKNLTTLAEKNGIKLGIVDLSCHSGNTLPLQNSHTCVISATGPDHYGYAGTNTTTYTNQFISNMKKGSSLEEVYLKAREGFGDLSFPMISTPVGNKLNDLLYDPLTPYLYSYNPKYDKFSEYLKAEAEKGEACQMPQERQELVNLISQFQKIKKYNKDIEYFSSNAKLFQEAVDKYYNFLNKLRTDYASIKGPDKNAPKEIFESVVTDGIGKSDPKWVYSQEEILAYNVEQMKKYYQDKINASTGFAKLSAQGPLANVLKIEARQKELMKQNPDFAKKKTFFEQMPMLERESDKLAREVAFQAKNFYQAYYKNAAAADKAPNPCKDFIL